MCFVVVWYQPHLPCGVFYWTWKDTNLLFGPMQTSSLMQNAHGNNIDGLVQERHNSIANALELRLSCTNPLIYVIH